MPFNQPHWNTATITPYAAPIESRFMTAALIGTATERNTIISSSTDSTITAPMNYGKRDATLSEMSMNVAVWPADVHRGVGHAVHRLRDHVAAQPVDQRRWWLRPAATSAG